MGNILKNKMILAEQYNTLKRQRDRRHCLTDRSHNQTRSLFLSSPSSLAIIRQLETIKSQQEVSTDWTHPKAIAAQHRIKCRRQGHIAPPNPR